MIRFRMAVVFLFFVLVSTTFCYNDPGALDFAAFNVQVFGKTKMEDPIVREYLKKIILRYDIIVIQEIRDSSGEAIQELLQLVNEDSEAHKRPKYQLTLSERLGRTSSKEQYAFLWRPDWVNVEATYQYPDPKDVFEREPFAVKFKSSRTEVATFGIVVIHTAPSDAQNEINDLATVYDDVSTQFGTENVIVTGDFNAGCNYLDDWSKVKLATDNRFYWLIDNSKDTTTKGTDCPYDRIVVAGNQLVSAIIPLSAGVLYFNEIYNLDYEKMLDVSDHYPVFMKIGTLKDAQNMEEWEGVTILEKVAYVSKSEARAARPIAEDLGYDVTTLYTQTGAQAVIQMKKSVIGEQVLLETFTDILDKLSDVVTTSEIEDAIRYVQTEDPVNFLPRGHGKFQTLYDFYALKARPYNVMIECNMKEDPCKCALKVKGQFQ